MADFSFLSDESIQRKAKILMENKRKIIGLGDESVPDQIADTDWVRQTLRAGSLEYGSSRDNLLRFWSSADTKFEDTSLGGNYVVNPRPQFTRYADTRALGISGDTDKVAVPKFSTRLGMGHYYAEAIDDTHQTIHMIFGQAEFNSLGSFFANYFDIGASRIANGGRWTQQIASFFQTATMLFVGVIFWPITATLYGLGKLEDIANFIFRSPGSKYYYMRSNMQLYWATVGNIVNRIAATSGMTSFTQDGNVFKKMSEMGDKSEPQMNSAYKEMLSAHFTDMFEENGFINIQRVVNRAQRLRNALEDKISDMSPEGFNDYVKTLMRDRRETSRGMSGASLAQAAKSYYQEPAKLFQQRFDAEIGQWKGDEGSDASKSVPLELTMRAVTVGIDKNKKVEKPTFLEKAWQSIEAEWRDGSAFASFRVDHTGSVDESFSSSTGETDLAATFNSTSAQVRAAKNSLAGGNIAGDNMLGAGIGAVVAAAQGVVEGALKAFNLDGILAPGQAYADIPEFWQNSNANMPRMSYSIDLVSPYGDPLSRMMNIYIPLAMLLAAALPLSTGKQSYTSPFLCQVFDQGRAITRLGIVDSLQVTRGTSNLAFNKNKEFMAVNVTFTIKDLSTVMHMPLDTGFSLDPLKGIADEDTLFSDYIGVLSCLSLGKSHYLSEKFAIQALNRWRGMQSMANSDRWIAWLHERTPLGWIDAAVKNTERY